MLHLAVDSDELAGGWPDNPLTDAKTLRGILGCGAHVILCLQVMVGGPCRGTANVEDCARRTDGRNADSSIIYTARNLAIR